MTATIRSVGLSIHQGDDPKPSSIELQVRAARSCLEKACLDPDDVDMLINTGIYRDDDINEPAIASFIQEGIRTKTLKKSSGKTFSFDLNNGGCGPLMAIEVMDGFIQSGVVRQGLVIAGDAHSVPGFTKGFDFVPSAAAVLLSSADNGHGFVGFHTQTYPEFRHMFEGYIHWAQVNSDHGTLAPSGEMRHVLAIRESQSYLQSCVACAVQSLTTFLDEMSTRLRDIDLIIPSQTPRGFPSRLRENIGWDTRVIDVTGTLGNLHTAGTLAALSSVLDGGELRGARNVLFLTVGSGITVSIALYRDHSC